MQHEQESRTAVAVALARALGSRHAADIGLLPRPYRRALRRAGRWLPVVARSPLGGLGGLTAHLRLRSAAIDAAIAEEVSDVVLLGAGLDARAHRLEALRGRRVWEVDHPASQRAKRRRAQALTPTADEVRYVPVRFGERSLREALLAAGFPGGARSAWVWEGVTMYLTSEAMVATLGEIADLAGQGSVLAMTYARPDMLVGMGANRAARAVFGSVGEPLIGLLSRRDVSERLADAGFELVSDTGARRWAEAHGGSWRASALFHAERLAVARRTG